MSGTFAELPTAEMNATLEEFKRASDRAAEEALATGTEALLSEAQFDAPVLTGALKESHAAVKVTRRLWMMIVNRSYALAVHETHPTKKRWFVNAIKLNFSRIFKAALERELRKEAGR